MNSNQENTAPNGPTPALEDAGITAPEATWSKFLHAIHGDCEGLIDLRFIDDRDRTRRFEASSVPEAVKRIRENARGHNCYAGIATRRTPGSGAKANLQQLGALWVDWDPADDYIDDDDRRGHREEIEIKLETMRPAAPSMIVWSGSGLHAYWILEEPIDVDTPESIQQVERTLRGLCDYVGADHKACDATRILRIPGTLNYPNAKKRAKGRVLAPCVLHQADNGGRF